MYLAQGTEIGGWIVGDRLGGGADGDVYSAKRLSKVAALKVFNIKSFGGGSLEAAKDRLEIQLSLAGEKKHKNLVEIYEGNFCSKLNLPYLAMEHIQGRSLDKLGEQLAPDVVCRIAAQLADAAEFLEQKNLVHRDIKPANVMLSEDNGTATLLDLSILHGPADRRGDDRLSGDEFVATLRYSPPEFVWRREEGDQEDAWRSITFYQIGATIYDLIAGHEIFHGMDTPRSHLYDAVKYVTPKLQSANAPAWLVGTVRAALLKDWRKRLEFLSWDSFRAPIEEVDHFDREMKIKLRQVHAQECSAATARGLGDSPRGADDSELWRLNRDLFSESRNYFMNSGLFPRFQTKQNQDLNRYENTFYFDPDTLRGIAKPFSVNISISHDAQPGFQKLVVDATTTEGPLTNASWVELFSVDSAFSRVKQVSLDALDAILPL
ncbi:serine/threonine protein kinase [Stenotrophomonas lactitubi]|uniref:serine/threonine protein kinase n=1 Tax=Stenotrophomonas lactitubi TaxID=2045214 RepID=UPI00320AB64E